MCDLEEKEDCGPAASFVPTLDAPFSATQRASTGVKSSCVVEQRPKWRRDESQRCRLLACVACVVIALCLVPTVSVTIFYKLSRDSANGGRPVDGQWVGWQAWSTCSVTCGGGSADRRRDCLDPAAPNDAAECVGNATETRQCSVWLCPDCARECPSGSVLNGDCSVCNCSATVVAGRVVSTLGDTTLPLAEVNVYVVGSEWRPSAVTNQLGRYELNGVCVGEASLVFTDPDYMTAEKRIKVTKLNMDDIEMIRTKLPRFSVEPESAAVFSGDSVSFSCGATGFPAEMEYQWFKNHNILGAAGPVYTLSAVTAQDEGEYQCRAVSAAGKRLSKVAELKVAEDGLDTCAQEPSNKTISLAATCRVTGATRVDVGRCEPRPCAVRGDTVADGALCCGPVATTPVQVICDGFQYQLGRITACGCAECAEGKTVSITGSLRVLIVADGTTRLERCSGTYVYGGDQLGITSDEGDFAFDVEPESQRVTVTFSSTNSDTNFVTQIVVFNIPRGVTAVERLVVVNPKPPPQTVDASAGGELDVKGADLPSAAKLTLPPNSVVDSQGNPVTGNVKVFATFADPRSPDGITAAPGEFAFDDDEGESQDLITNGVLGLFIEDDDGNPLMVSGKVTLTVDTQALGIGENVEGQPDTYAWIMDPESGKWKMSAPVVYERKSRRKRQATRKATVRISVPWPLPYINLDKPADKRSRCIVVVQVFADLTLQDVLPSVSIQVLTLPEKGTIFQGFTTGSTNEDGIACVPIRCGYRHVIVVKSSLGTPSPHARHNLPDGFPFANNAQTVNFTSPDINSIVDDSGPLISDTDRRGGRKCYDASASTFRFIFAVPIVTWPGVLHAIQPLPRRRLSWYNDPVDSPQRRVCMIKVWIQTSETDAADIRVFGTSRSADVQPSDYGTYTTSVRQSVLSGCSHDAHAACVLVKCPNDNANTAFDSVSTDVNIKIIHPKKKCTFKWHAYAQQCCGSQPDYRVTTASNSSFTVTITAPDHRCPKRGLSFGYYEATGRHNTVYRSVLQECFQTHWSMALFDCNDDDMPTPFQGAPWRLDEPNC